MHTSLGGMLIRSIDTLRAKLNIGLMNLRYNLSRVTDSQTDRANQQGWYAQSGIKDAIERTKGEKTIKKQRNCNETRE